MLFEGFKVAYERQKHKNNSFLVIIYAFLPDRRTPDTKKYINS